MYERLMVRSVEPTADEVRAAVRSGRPTLFRGGGLDWPCTQKWSKHYLSEVAGSRTCTVNSSADGRFGIYSSRESETTGAWTGPLREFLADLGCRPPGEPTRYMQQRNLVCDFPMLRPDIREVPGMDDIPVRDLNIWIGERSSRIPCHYDTFDNFIVQVSGSKLVQLYSASEGEHLYPGLEGAFFASHVDVEQPDLSAFPRFGSARRLGVIEIRRGDLFFLPPYTWHFVRTTSAYSISLNFWFHSVLAGDRRAFLDALSRPDEDPLALRGFTRRQRDLLATLQRLRHEWHSD